MITMVISIIAAGVSFVSMLVAIMGRRRERITATLEFFKQGDSEKQKSLRTAIHLMDDKEIKSAVEEWKSGKKGIDDCFTGIVSFYDTWGKMLVQRYLPLKTFDGMSGVILIRVYKKMMPYIEARREKESIRQTGKTEETVPYRYYAYYFEEAYKKVLNRYEREHKKAKYRRNA